jgi:hypothetical protein
MSLFLTISFSEQRRLSLAPFLLFTTIDTVVDTDSYSNILVERVRTVFLMELIFNFLFKAIIE